MLLTESALPRQLISFDGLRNIYAYELNNVILHGEYYPNIFAETNNIIYQIIDEKTMSMKDNGPICTVNTDNSHPTVIVENCMFFMYNTDNYYHFLYDTIGYINTYNALKKLHNVNLVMGYPNPSRSQPYDFVLELLALCGIQSCDILYHKPNYMYKTLYVSTSYTHNGTPDAAPHKSLYELYNKLIKEVKVKKLPPAIDKIYISRRTKNGTINSNIGTNYTQKRVLVNEDEVVSLLQSRGFIEIFSEDLNMTEKIHLFNNAKCIVGCIGGGVANAVFGSKETKLITIVSPGFLTVNKRFMHCLDRMDCTYVTDTYHNDTGKYKLYMRVKNTVTGQYGEIYQINDNNVLVNIAPQGASGWNALCTYNTAQWYNNDIIALDKGLNSPFTLNIDTLIAVLDNCF